MSILSARFRPPTLVTGEGDPLVMCEAVFDLAPDDVAALTAAFDEAYESASDDGATDGRWHFNGPADVGTRILAELTLTEGPRLHVTSTSERRFDQVLGVVRSVVPGTTAITESRTPAGDLQSRSRDATQVSPPPFADPTDPAIAAALAQFTADYEQRWLDMELPALAGLTPRQAADDPTRREDVIRLLNSFDDLPSDPGSMDASRLRTALNL